jgi:type II secretory ATPase GspE/PulE/Tfp pilus assembly ATPase PilB-like protein
MAETTVRSSQARQLVEVAAPIDGTEAPIIDLVNQILLQAIERGGSDLHLVPSEHTLDVQLRVDGVMQPLMTLPREVAPAVTGRLKIIAELDVSERRRPQDGRCTIRVSGRPVDLRAACIATHWGETLVMRILRPLEVPDGVGSLGLGAEGQVQWNRMIRSPNGLILVTGPTGSGKTSTLYATLGQIDRRERNVITVEDPVEYPLGGMRQIQVAPVAGITFASALRSILRLDPDVILIGEIRDEVTLEIALEAALTGHLVISTLHTNDAVSAVTRMIEMGAPRHQVAASLVGALAQRLVRRICRGCLRERAPTEDEAAFLGPEARTVAYGVGCDACAGVGFRGRLGVFEILESSAELSDAISGQASTHQLWRLARAEGLETLLEDGRRKVLQGQTTVAEVHRVIGARERHA